MSQSNALAVAAAAARLRGRAPTASPAVPHFTPPPRAPFTQPDRAPSAKPTSSADRQLSHPLPTLGWVRPLLGILLWKAFKIELSPNRQERRQLKQYTARENQHAEAAANQAALAARVVAPKASGAVVTVVSTQGGVGKTHTVGHMATIAARERPASRVIAVDNNPDQGRLGPRLRVPSGCSMRALHALRKKLTTYDALVDTLAWTEDGVAVVLSAPSNERDDAFGAIEYDEVLEYLLRLANVVFNDCGTNLEHALTVGALSATKQLIYVADATQDGLDLAIDALDTYCRLGYTELVEHAIVIVNRYSLDDQRQLEFMKQFIARVAPRVGRIQTLRYDEFLFRRVPVDLAELDAETLKDFYCITAAAFEGVEAFNIRKQFGDGSLPEVETNYEPDIAPLTVSDVPGSNSTQESSASMPTGDAAGTDAGFKLAYLAYDPHATEPRSSPSWMLGVAAKQPAPVLEPPFHREPAPSSSPHQHSAAETPRRNWRGSSKVAAEANSALGHSLIELATQHLRVQGQDVTERAITAYVTALAQANPGRVTDDPEARYQADELDFPVLQ